MKLIVGLGNPGTIYSNSRHNIGFRVVKALSQFFKITLKRDTRTFSLSARAKFKNQQIILATPLTFMNLSGTAVAALVKKYKVDLANLLVVCDDLDLEFGRLKIRPAGSSAGHRGLSSIIERLKSGDFPRLRIGIGRPHPKIDAAEYVLSAFTRKEKEQVREMVGRAGDCCQSWIAKGIDETMNIFNRKEI